MLFKRKHEKMTIKNIEEKIETNQKINIFELEKLLELRYEIVFEYKGKSYEIIQNGKFIELYNDCFYEDHETKWLSYTKYSSPKEFIENAKIGDRLIAQVMDEIRIIHC